MLNCDNEEPPFLSVTNGGQAANNIQSPSTESTQQLTITASGNWSISVDQSWVKLSKVSGTGKGDISIDVDANPTVSARSANIKVQANDVSNPQTIVITQAGCDPILKVSRSLVPFEAIGSTDTLRVVSNTSWTISENESWLSITPSSGTGNATIVLNVVKNVGLSNREGSFSVGTSPIKVTKDVSIVQEPGVTIVAGGNGSGSGLGQLDMPSTLWGDNKGNIFITDQYNHRVMKWAAKDLQGTLVAGGHGPGPAFNQLDNPYGIFVNSDGDMYIADAPNHRVVKWTAGSSSGSLIAGGNGGGTNLNQINPTAVYVKSNGDLYAAEGGLVHRITKWEPGANSGILIAEGAPVSFATGVAVDKDGNVYIVSGDNSNVTKWAPGATEGVVVAGGNDRGTDLNQLTGPSGIFVDDDGSIYISEQGNDRIVKWLPGATAGIVVAGGNGKGSSLNQFNSVSSLWVDDKGYIYACDQANHRIVRWVE